jgi:uncharacterized SAM-binding protein YcdF (DUF218 family)
VPVEEVPVPSAGSIRRPASRRGRRWRRLMVALAVVVIAALVVTARLFVWPDQGMPPKVDAIVSLDTPGGTLDAALGLARQHRAPFLVISLGTPESGYGCPRPMAGVRLICFNPSPGTTRGEAEFIGRLARKYHWHSVAVVTITPQDTRARLRIGRCFAGPVYVVPTRIALVSWPYQITYQWGALFKALVVQHGC